MDKPSFMTVIKDAIKDPETLRRRDIDPDEQLAAEELRQAIYRLRMSWRRAMQYKTGMYIFLFFIAPVIIATIQLF